MNKFVKTQTVFFQSSKRHDTTSTPSTVDIDFSSDMIRCEDDEIMSIKIVSFSLYNSVYLLNETNKSFNLKRLSDNHTTTVNMRAGNYPYRTLAQYINMYMGFDVCAWDKVQNKFSFTFSEPFEITFNDESYKTLGFTNTAHSGISFISDNILNPTAHIQNLCVHLRGLTPYKCYNVDNIDGQSKISDLLMVIPYNIVPFDVFTYTNHGNHFNMYFFEKSIQQLSLTITDMDGNIIDDLPEYVVTFEINTYIEEEENTTLQTLQKILEYTRLSFLSKYINK